MVDSQSVNKIKGRKRHLLVDTEGFVLKVKVHRAQRLWTTRGSRRCCSGRTSGFPDLRHLWLDAGYRGEDKGADWVQKTLCWSVDLVERPRKPAPEEVLLAWAREWEKRRRGRRLAETIAPQRLLCVAEEVGSGADDAWIEQNRRMSKDYERSCASGEAFVYAAMIRLMTRRLARV